MVLYRTVDGMPLDARELREMSPGSMFEVSLEAGRWKRARRVTKTISMMQVLWELVGR